MNTNITISLDMRRSKNDGTYPVIMRLGHNLRTTSIPLDISVLEKDWDAKNKEVKKSYTGLSTVTRLNNFIQKMKAEAMDIILKLNEKGELNGLSVTALREKIIRAENKQSFFVYGDSLVKEMVELGQIGNARCYKGALAVLKTFNKDKDLAFNEITYKLLSEFEKHHKRKGNQANGLAVYIRTFRAIYNKAIKDGLVEKENHPFADYKVKTVPTEKRALDAEFLKKLIDLQLEKDDILLNARNYFVASYMMYGMNFTDMAFLKKTNIIHGRIHYRRKKTSKLYDIKIGSSLQAILDHYKNDSSYIFPIIRRDTALLQAKDIQWARKRYNKKLKELAKLCGIEQNLTSYVSRHSFATQAMMQQVPLTAISTMLGHSSLKTTEIYLKSLPSDVLDGYNALILQ
ncbi:site-specific integrase [Hufsiella ginkgonis]|uniref:Tyrosine-type recombinase/integrase n=1 Tax=Hufsiella ginkgonis TaxID=2695274 RepID=A0A7K1Y421_9SPHI|nr:site-specific integrase [Hufsiella ginkgonis]MXV18001.1 tyrosine-type recombinase/integrase [Hufsiella ginkgonis]